MPSIYAIEQLTNLLDQTPAHEHARIMKRIAFDPATVAQYATWTPGGYTRNCLARTDAYEMILLCWDIGAAAPVHDHGGENCWVYQIEGTVEELRYEQRGNELTETHKMQLAPGKLTYMHDRMGYHSLTNISGQRALTLHIYAAPIDSCKVYCDEKGCFERKDMAYHTYLGEAVTELAA